MKTDFSQLIPELKDWNNGKGIDVESFVVKNSLNVTKP
jgi:hypothetical protein